MESADGRSDIRMDIGTTSLFTVNELIPAQRAAWFERRSQARRQSEHSMQKRCGGEALLQFAWRFQVNSLLEYAQSEPSDISK